MIIRNIHWIIMITSLISIVAQPFDGNKILYKFNDWRKNVSEKVQIANMWKLEWDEHLVEEAKKMPSSVDEFEHGDYYRWVLTNANETSRDQAEQENFLFNEVTEGIEKFKTREEKQSNHVSWARSFDPASFVEVFTPMQTKLGCIMYRVSHTYISLRKPYHDFMYEYDTLCLIGPHGWANVNTTEKIIEGPPGSDCGTENGEGHAELGLCVGPVPTTTVPPPPPPVEVEEEEKKKKEEEYDLILILTNAVSGKDRFSILIVFFLWIIFG